jgi:hypothetical protein
MKDWERFFKENIRIKEVDCSDDFDGIFSSNTSIDEMYEAFKARLIDELGLGKKPRKKAKVNKDFKLDVFEAAFYDPYPKKAGRKEAIKAWNKLRPDRDLTVKMWRHYSVAYKDTKKQFIPNPATYLNQEKWKDEIIVKTKEEKLLKLPSDDVKLEAFCRKHNLPAATTDKDYFAYRARLKKYIDENNIFER